MFEAQQAAKRKSQFWIYGVLIVMVLCWLVFLAFAALVPSSDLAKNCTWIFRASVAVALLGLVLAPAAIVAVAYTESQRTRRVKQLYAPLPTENSPRVPLPQPKGNECSCPSLMLRWWFCRAGFWLSFVCVCLAITCLAVIGSLKAPMAALPVREGRLSASFLAHDVIVERDSLGVVHLTGQSASDVLAAQGFVVAQERLYQLDVTRRLAQGSLAGLLGVDALEADVFMRTLGLATAVTQHRKKNSSPPFARQEEAFRQGINEFVARVNNGTSSLAYEYSTLGISRVEPFSKQDMDLLLQMAALLVSDDTHSLAAEMRRYFLVANRNLTVERAHELQPPTPARNPPIGNRLCVPPPAASTAALSAALSTLRSSATSYGFRNDLTRRLLEPYFRLNSTGHARGSAWVVSAERAGADAPLLALDFHSTLTVPSAFIMFELEWPGFSFHGFNLVGTPLISAGTLTTGNSSDASSTVAPEHRSSSSTDVPTGASNDTYSIAWGITSSQVDALDSTIIQMDGPNAYWRNGVSTAVQESHQQVHVRGSSSPVNITVRSTAYGPILSDAVRLPGSAPIAVAWPLGGAPSSPLRLLVGISSEADWRSHLPYQHASLSHVFADSHSKVALHVGGVLPLRSEGDGSWPLLSNHTSGWSSTSSVNIDIERPSTGYVVAANNRICADTHFYGVDWAEGWRAARLHERISNFTQFSVEEQLSLQTDRVSVEWRQRWAPLLELFAPSERSTNWYNILRRFDGDMLSKSAGALMAQWWVHSQLLAIEPLAHRHYVATFLARNESRTILRDSLHRAVENLPIGANYLGHMASSITAEPVWSFRGVNSDCFWSSVSQGSGGPSTLNAAYYDGALGSRVSSAARLAVSFDDVGRIITYQGASGHVFDRMTRASDANPFSAPYDAWREDNYVLLSREAFIYGSVSNLTLTAPAGAETR